MISGTVAVTATVRCNDRRPALLLAFVMALATWAILLRRSRRILPVVNYHSVSDHPGWLRLPELSISPAFLEAQLRYLKRSGYQSVFLSELVDLLGGSSSPPRRCIALTFDDGFADNWVAVLPLLEKYGMKATIFVSPDFIDPRPLKRPSIHENPAPGDWAGYLTLDELTAMCGSGRIEIQPHGKTHARCFTSGSIRRFILPSTPNIWLYWNAHPEHKTDWWAQPDLTASLKGFPLFTDGPALAHPAYHPDPAACQHMLDWTARQGDALFERPDGAERLHAEWRTIRQRIPDRSRLETDAGFAERITSELQAARQILRDRLGIPADILCWPQNAVCELGERLALAEGYRATVSNRHRTRNRINRDPSRITRFHITEEPFGPQAVRINLLVFIMRCCLMEGMHALLPLVCLVNKLEKHSIRKKRSAALCRNQPSIWY